MPEPVYDFEWDVIKAAANLKKHGVTFEQAASIFLDQLSLTVFDANHSEYEERWFTLGYSNAGKLLAVAHTHRASNLNGVNNTNYFCSTSNQTGTTILCR